MSTLVLGQIQPRVIRPLGRIARLASIAIYITMAAVTVRIVGDILLGIYDRSDYPLYGYDPGYRESLVQASRYTELIASNAAFALLLVWFYRLRVNTEVRAPGAATISELGPRRAHGGGRLSGRSRAPGGMTCRRCNGRACFDDGSTRGCG